MIRINLLAEGRRPVIARKAKPKFSLGDQDPSAYILAAGILLAALIAGGQWFLLSREIKGLDGRISVAQAEVDALRPILQEVEDFKAKKAELQRKIDVITELTLLQEGPVHIMDKVSRALPELLWIRTMNVRGRRVEVAGTAFNTTAIAAFIENLDKVPEFFEPEPGSVVQDRGSTYNFQIAFTFVQEEPEQQQADDEV